MAIRLDPRMIMWPGMMNHMHSCCSLHKNVNFLSARMKLTSSSSLKAPLSVSRWCKEKRSKEDRNLCVRSLRNGSRLCHVVVNCSSCESDGLGGIMVEDVEAKRKKIFYDGYAVFPKMWSEEEVEAAGKGGVVVGREQEKVLELFLNQPIGVFNKHLLLHEPGFRCTDAATSPEPWWHQSWQISGLDYDNRHPSQRPLSSATLFVSLSDRKQKNNCGGVAVFPRSHWIIMDCIANSTSGRLSFPQPFDVPAAAPIELGLGCGDMALLHPWLAYATAPNVTCFSMELLIFSIGDATSVQFTSRTLESGQMWSLWYSMEEYLADQVPKVEAELSQLQTEEAKAQYAGWQDPMRDVTLELSSLVPRLSTHVAPRDLLTWRLQTSALQSIQDGQWTYALSVLRRLAGLRPNCYWTALQAGQCCIRSAPPGQLEGRAGRKCTLEDGERFLLRAIEIAPGWPLAYCELITCFALMGRGRELEIPGVMEVMKRNCNLEQLCLRYGTFSDTLRKSWNTCEALCNKIVPAPRA